MSALQELLVALEGISQDAERHSSALAQQAQRLRLANAQAEAAVRHTSRADGGQVTAALHAAESATTKAAQQLHQAALVGRRFVAGHAAGSGTPVVPAGAAAPTAADVEALGDYTGTGYRAINDALRGTTAVTPDAQQRAAAVSAALAKLPDHVGPAFRGTTLTPAQLASYVPGARSREDGFTSASSDQSSAFPGNTLFILVSKRGKDVAPFSPFAESEILFDKGTDFYVTSNFYDPNVGKQVINMMEV